VKGVDPTESGLQILALLAGVILSSIVSGILVSRTGRYRLLTIASLVTMSAGILLLTGLRANTDLPVLWIWMFITGLGIGPTLSTFTIIIQSVVPFSRLGVATGSLVFFRQIGGSVGLAVVGTIFAQSFNSKLAPELVAQGVPADAAAQIAQQATGGQGAQLTQVGGNLADTLRATLPPQMQPFINNIVDGLHQAFSLAVADTFWFGLIATLVALGVVVVALPEVPLRGIVRRDTVAPASGRQPEMDAPPAG
jgi:MFS family permease